MSNSRVASSAKSTAANYHPPCSSDVEVQLNKNRPKHLVEGVVSGVGHIVAGAVGACGIVILAPVVGAKDGQKMAASQKNSVASETVGAAVVGGGVGLGMGLVNGVSVAGGGLLAGVGQVLRGAVNTPAAIIEPFSGKWWNVNEGQWVKTHLGSEAEWIAALPEYDEDILGEEAIPEHIRRARDEERKLNNNTSGYNVMETELYDLLGVSPDATEDAIKRRYYHINRMFSPGRCGGGGDAAAKKHAKIGRAYVILTNKELRARYDAYGIDAVYGVEGGQSEEDFLDPMELFSVMFAAEEFNDYIGRLAAASNALVGEQVSSKITLAEARSLQKRRVTRVALKLAQRLKKWTKGQQEEAKADWEAEAEKLAAGNFGLKLVHLIGQAYAASACLFLGSFESGLGMPSLKKWFERQKKVMSRNKESVESKFENFAVGDKERQKIEKLASAELSMASTEKDRRNAEHKLFQDIGQDTIKILWRQTVLDITNTIFEAVQMVCFDQDLNKETRKMRGEGLEAMGEIFKACQYVPDESVKKEEEKYREIAFYAVMDTILRQKEATLSAPPRS